MISNGGSRHILSYAIMNLPLKSEVPKALAPTVAQCDRLSANAGRTELWERIIMAQ